MHQVYGPALAPGLIDRRDEDIPAEHEPIVQGMRLGIRGEFHDHRPHDRQPGRCRIAQEGVQIWNQAITQPDELTADILIRLT